MIEKAPVLLRVVKGSLSISQNDTAVLLMIQGRNDTYEECITVKSGGSCASYKLQQQRMAIISGDDEVEIWPPTHFVLNLVLHPKRTSAPAKKAET
jgi:hypothetical protein